MLPPAMHDPRGVEAQEAEVDFCLFHEHVYVGPRLGEKGLGRI